MQTIRVRTSTKSVKYDIRIGSGVLAEVGKEARGVLGEGTRRIALISYETVFRLFGKQTMSGLNAAGFEVSTWLMKDGEQHKSLRSLEQALMFLSRSGFERSDAVVALGGGVVGDLAGFAAASYLRGIPFVQVPTTLLAQVDSSVGGKTGINLKAGKNLVGAFYQPRLVLCDLATLDTLPPRELRSGLSEVIKYGIIYDALFFRRIVQQMNAALKRDSAVLAKIIARCYAIKAEVVSQDETETGLRAILNFGHTVGHALEAISGYGKCLHGEAIAIGQVCAARLSERILGLPGADVERIRALRERAGLPV